MTNCSAQTSGTKWHVNTFELITSVWNAMAAKRIVVKHVYQLCLQFIQVTITLFFPAVPQRSPNGPTNNAPQQALPPLKPFFSA